MTRSGIYRVRVSHQDPEHHLHAEAFYGPAFDAGYEHTVSEATGEPVDLLQHAQRCADRCRGEHPDQDGYTTRVVELAHHDNDADSTWEQVS